MRVSRSGISDTSGLTVNSDMDFLSTYQVKALASPASGEALRKGSKDVSNAEVADAAAILLSKIATTDKITNAMIKSNAAIAFSKLESVPLLPTREVFFPCTMGTDLFVYNSHTSYLIDAAGDEANIEFYVPSDFNTIVSVTVVKAGKASATHRLNYKSEYGQVGENFHAHSETLLDQDTEETFRGLTAQDISSILSSLSAGDHVGIEVSGDATNMPNDFILGVVLQYT